jgi:hypothetical protein
VSGRLSRVATSLLLVTALVYGPMATTATADGGPGESGPVSAGLTQDQILAAAKTYSANTPGGSGGGDGCSWSLSDGGPVSGLPVSGPSTYPYTDTASGLVWHQYLRVCPGSGASLVAFPQLNPSLLLPNAEQELKRRIPKPEPYVFLHDKEFPWVYVKHAVDFRAINGTWGPLSVTAQAGPVWATATAQPKLLVFEAGDPKGPPGASCAGDGPTALYDVKIPGLCSYKGYKNASSTSSFDHYHFISTFTIRWSLSWTSSTGAGGDLGSFETKNTLPIAVAEIKALTECTGPLPGEGGC